MTTATRRPSWASSSQPVATKDELFRNVAVVADFNFGETVASVFDDMLGRSVPFYQEIQRMIAEMATDVAVEGTNIYDLGCSTGNTLLNLDASAARLTSGRRRSHWFCSKTSGKTLIIVPDIP